MKQRIMSLILCVALCVFMLPTAAFAAEQPGGNAAEPAGTAVQVRTTPPL